MLQKSSVSEIIKNASKGKTTNENPVTIEELFLAATLQEFQEVKDTRTIFDGFYREIVKPLEFTKTENRVLWWAMNSLYTMPETPSINCANLETFFQTPQLDLKVDRFAGVHESAGLFNKNPKITHAVMLQHIAKLCALEVRDTASGYLTMWRSALAEKMRSARINQIKVQYDQTGNIDAFFEQMANIEREYRKAITPNKYQESMGLADLDVDAVAEIIASTRPETHFIPTADDELNKAVHGYPRGAISLITTVSGGGKSLHILRDAYSAMEKGYKVLYLSLELSEQRILRELMTVGGHVPSSVIEQITTEEEMKHYVKQMLDKAKADAKRNRGQFYYEVCEDIELKDLLDITEVHLATLDIDVVFVDLFDEVPIEGASQTNPSMKGGFFEVMLNKFKGLARTYDAAIVGAVQLKAEAVLNNKIQQEAIGGSIFYAKKSSLITYIHRSSEDYYIDGEALSAYGREVLKDRESGWGRKGFQYLRWIDRDTKLTLACPFKTIQKLEREIAKQQKELENEF